MAYGLEIVEPTSFVHHASKDEVAMSTTIKMCLHMHMDMCIRMCTAICVNKCVKMSVMMGGEMCADARSAVHDGSRLRLTDIAGVT